MLRGRRQWQAARSVKTSAAHAQTLVPPLLASSHDAARDSCCSMLSQISLPRPPCPPSAPLCLMLTSGFARVLPQFAAVASCVAPLHLCCCHYERNTWLLVLTGRRSKQANGILKARVNRSVRAFRAVARCGVWYTDRALALSPVPAVTSFVGNNIHLKGNQWHVAGTNFGAVVGHGPGR